MICTRGLAYYAHSMYVHMLHYQYLIYMQQGFYKDTIFQELRAANIIISQHEHHALPVLDADASYFDS